MRGEPQRRPVSPVSVVDGKQQRARVSHPHRQPIERVHGTDQINHAFRRGSAAEQPRGRGGCAGEEIDGPGRGNVVEQLPDHSERVHSLKLRAARGEHVDRGRAGRALGVAHQPRLAGSGRRLDQQHTSLTLQRRP
jgi:hypothetical protein